MKRVAVAALAVAALAAVLIAVRCRGADKPESGTSVTGGGAAARARDEKPDPRTVARVAIHGSITAKGGGGPIAGAQVCTMGQIEHVPADETRDPKCVLSDAQGRYGFDQLYAGSYRVSASAPQHAPGEWRGPAPDRLGWFGLAAGERRDDIDIALATGGVEVIGSVSDINGGPIAEAWVYVSGGWEGYEPSAITRAAADGTFTVWLAPGRVTGSARADGYASGATSGKAPTRHLDILLTPESVLAGIVVDAVTGAPVAGAMVTASPSLLVAGSDDLEAGGDIATSDAHGHFRITGLVPGRYKPAAQNVGGYGTSAEAVLLGLGQTVEGVVIGVHALPVVVGRVVVDDGSPTPSSCTNGFITIRSSSDREFLGDIDRVGSVRIDAVLPGTYKVSVWCLNYVPAESYPDLVIANADITGLEWKVHPGGTIIGTVKTKAGAPVGHARIEARTVAGVHDYGTDTTQDDGTFSLRGLTAGEYAIELTAPGYPPLDEPVKATAIVGQETRIEMVVAEGGAIAGVVVDEGGRQVANVSVSARGDQRTTDQTGDDGSFVIAGLRAGSYRVTVSRAGGDPLRKPGSSADDVEGERVAVTAGHTTKLRLVVENQSGTIGGVVVDAAGAPVSDAYLATERESDAETVGATATAARRSRFDWGRRSVVTDAGGAFKVSDLSPGKYTVRAYRKGGGEAIAEHVPVGTASARLVLGTTGAIGGTLTIKRGGAPEDFTVSLTDGASGFTRREWFFGTAGRFLLADLPPGTFALTASTARGRVDAKLTIAAGERKVDLALVLEPPTKVKGRLIALDDGAPVPRLRVMAVPRGDTTGSYGNPDWESTSGPDGRFVIEAAPAGRIWIQAYPVDYETSPQGTLIVTRTLGDAAEVDVGDLRIPRRRHTQGTPEGDLGFDLADPDVEADRIELEVGRIRPASPAAKSGLAVGDVIVSVDGTDVKGENGYLALTLMQVAVGTKVTLGLARDATVTITAGPAPAQSH